MHSLIVGMTESGKTTLAKYLCKGLAKRGKKTAVLDPLIDVGWETEFQTNNPGEFLALAKKTRESYLFVDEGSVSIGRFNVPMEWLATMSRHWGHSAFFITQGMTQLGPTIRNNCSRLYLFACSKSIARLAAEEFNQPEVISADRLRVGEFFIVSRFDPLRRGSIDFKKSRINIA